MPELDVRVEDVSESHIAAYTALSRLEYGDRAISDPTHLRWKFLKNPAGPSKGIHVLHDGQLVGRLVAQRRRFASPRSEADAAYMVDLLVHPDHRGMPVLLKLFGALPRLREAFDLIVVTPNAAGLLVWKNFAKLPVPFDLGVHAVPLRPGRLAGRVSGGVTGLAAFTDPLWRLPLRGVAALAGAAGPRLDTAWPTDGELDEMFAVRPASAGGRRDRAFIDWRFRRDPVFAYEVLFVRKAGRLRGYVATRRAGHEGYDTLFVIDAFASSGLTRSDWSRIAWELVRRASASGGPELVMILGTTTLGPLGAMARAPFVRVPARFLPQRTPVFAQWWSEPAFPLEASSVRLTLADLDMF